MKAITITAVTLAVINIAVWSYLMGRLTPAVEYQPLLGYTETGCNDINAQKNSDTGKVDVVCEVTMKAEDDNVRIFKGDNDDK